MYRGSLCTSVFLFILVNNYNFISGSRIKVNNNASEADIYLNSYQLIEKYSGNAEKHSVTTEDGYILSLFRIPGKGTPVLLVHGIADSSDGWLVLGPEGSAGFKLAREGFDVWLYNSRGNGYSNGRAKNFTEEQYWDFSFEEMGTQDLPATIEYILSTTNQSKLSYVGFSQGTTIFLVMCSMKPEYNKKINKAILLAPIATLNDNKVPIIHVLEPFINQLRDLSLYLLEMPFTREIRSLGFQNCKKNAPLYVLCQIIYYFGFGLETRNVPTERLQVVASHGPTEVATKDLVHFMQIYAKRRFQRYNYTLEKNMELYSAPEPPEYNISLVTTKTYLIMSEFDWYSTTKDVKLLMKKLPNVVKCNVIPMNKKFTHLEVIFGSRARKFVIDPMIKILKGDE